MKNQIILKSIKFKNLFSYGNQWNTFDFKTGISFITGKNVLTDRRNFTGKSSFLKIIPFALFGKVEGLTKAQIINWKNKKQAEVILTFTKNDSEYKIHRGIKPDIFTVLKDNIEIPQSSNKKYFQDEVEETILGMDFNTFMNIVYCDTNNSQSILNASKPVKREYIENLFNLSYFVKLKDAANTKKKAVNDKVIEVKSFIESLKSKIDLSNTNRMKYIEDKAAMLSGKTTLLEDLEKIKSKIDLKIINEFNEKLIVLKDRQKDIDEKLNKDRIVTEKIKSKIFYVAKFKADEVKQEIVDQTDTDITNLCNEIVDLENSISEVEVDLLDKNVKYTEGIITEEKSDLQFNNNLVKTIDAKISDLEKELKSKPKEGICPTCLQKVDFKHIESEFVNKIVVLKNERIDLSNKITKIQSKIVEQEKILSERIKIKTDFETTKNTITEKKKQLTEYQEMLEKQKDGIKKYKKFQRFQKAHTKLSVLLDKIITRIENTPSFTKHIELVESKLKGFDEKKQEISILEERIKSFDSKILSMNEYIKSADNQISTDKISIKKNIKVLDDLNLMIEYYKQIIILCGDDKAKQYAITSYLPYLNERINYYLNKSGVLFYVKLTGWLDYVIMGPGIKDCTYNNLSGAERISLDRSMQLASIDVKKQQSSALIDVLILDEALDGSTDQQGLVDMMNIIKAKQEDDNSKVLIVSHRSELGELDELFDNKYLVIMDKYSKIKEN